MNIFIFYCFLNNFIKIQFNYAENIRVLCCDKCGSNRREWFRFGLQRAPKVWTWMAIKNGGMRAWRKVSPGSFSEKDMKTVKSGYLARYRRGFFCSRWSKEWVSLYEDSTFSWYSDKSLSKPKGSIRIGDAPEYFAVGEWTKVAPTKPKSSNRYSVDQLLAIGGKKRNEVIWFAAGSTSEINDWLTAISNTLPPPPQTPETVDNKEKDDKNPASKHAMKRKTKPDKRCQCYNISPSQQKSRIYDADYTPLSAACIDWGHGWGWGQNAFPNTSIYLQDVATITHTTNYIYTPPVEDYTYSYSGLEDADWGIADLVL